MNSTYFVGNMTRDPELRFSPDGKVRATLSVAVNEGQGENEKTHFIDVTVFGDMATNVAETLPRGARVIVVGRLNTYTTEVPQADGTVKKINRVSFTASAIGPDLRFAQAKVVKVKRDAEGNAATADVSAPAQAPAQTAAAAAQAAVASNDF